MADQKQPMQADGAGTKPRAVDDSGEVASRRGNANPGESGGGPYTNGRHAKGGGDFGTFFGHGGQSEQAYHGPGQLGEGDIGSGEQPNAASKER